MAIESSWCFCPNKTYYAFPGDLNLRHHDRGVGILHFVLPSRFYSVKKYIVWILWIHYVLYSCQRLLEFTWLHSTNRKADDKIFSITDVRKLFRQQVRKLAAWLTSFKAWVWFWRQMKDILGLVKSKKL